MLESVITSIIVVALLGVVILVLRGRKREAKAIAEHRAAHAKELRQHLGQKPKRTVVQKHSARFENAASAGQRLGGGKRTWGSQGFPK